jgi:carbon starvation protein
MFGVANQLLATLALAIGTSYLINHGKRKYIWITVVPMTFVGVTTITGGVMNLFNIYIPQINNGTSQIQGIVNATLTVIILVCVLLILVIAVTKWIKNFSH